MCLDEFTNSLRATDMSDLAATGRDRCVFLGPLKKALELNTVGERKHFVELFVMANELSNSNFNKVVPLMFFKKSSFSLKSSSFLLS